ncbi:site-specific recombinase XerD [Pedobacter sp. CG_S7]|uniref:hypothetical protein n=1 Tax=Pedobacter sp. CG_S7 TaxID=3143930 RepID=UPI0033992678
MNEYLKEIEYRCKICEKLTSHIARHIFATKVTLFNSVPLRKVISVGNTNIRTTQHFAKILDIKVGANMALLKKKVAII